MKRKQEEEQERTKATAPSAEVEPELDHGQRVIDVDRHRPVARVLDDEDDVEDNCDDSFEDIEELLRRAWAKKKVVDVKNTGWKFHETWKS